MLRAGQLEVAHASLSTTAADVNARDMGQFYAITSGVARVVNWSDARFLIDHGADGGNARSTTTRSTPLHPVVAGRSDWKLLAFLVDHGADA